MNLGWSRLIYYYYISLIFYALPCNSRVRFVRRSATWNLATTTLRIPTCRGLTRVHRHIHLACSSLRFHSLHLFRSLQANGKGSFKYTPQPFQAARLSPIPFPFPQPRRSMSSLFYSQHISDPSEQPRASLVA